MVPPPQTATKQQGPRCAVRPECRKGRPDIVASSDEAVKRRNVRRAAGDGRGCQLLWSSCCCQTPQTPLLVAQRGPAARRGSSARSLQRRATRAMERGKRPPGQCILWWAASRTTGVSEAPENAPKRCRGACSTCITLCQGRTSGGRSRYSTTPGHNTMETTRRPPATGHAREKKFIVRGPWRNLPVPGRVSGPSLAPTRNRIFFAEQSLLQRFGYRSRLRWLLFALLKGCGARGSGDKAREARQSGLVWRPLAKARQEHGETIQPAFAACTWQPTLNRRHAWHLATLNRRHVQLPSVTCWNVALWDVRRCCGIARWQSKKTAQKRLKKAWGLVRRPDQPLVFPLAQCMHPHHRCDAFRPQEFKWWESNDLDDCQAYPDDDNLFLWTLILEGPVRNQS